MIAIANQTPKPKTDWHRGFLALLPAIQRYARYAFRRLTPEEHEEAVTEVIANAVCMYHRLAELNKEGIAYPSPLALYGIARFRANRRVGSALNSNDVLSPAAQKKRVFHVHRLTECALSEQTWVDALADSRQMSVPDQAALRIDFRQWLARLNPRNRRLAGFLALGNTTQDASRQFKLSSGRISQLRRELCEDWMAFHGEDVTAPDVTA